MVSSDDGRQVPVVQAYAFGKYLGYLKVTFDEAGNVVKSTGNPILLNSSISQGKENFLLDSIYLIDYRRSLRHVQRRENNFFDV